MNHASLDIRQEMEDSVVEHPPYPLSSRPECRWACGPLKKMKKRGHSRLQLYFRPRVLGLPATRPLGWKLLFELLSIGKLYYPQKLHDLSSTLADLDSDCSAHLVLCHAVARWPRLLGSAAVFIHRPGSHPRPAPAAGPATRRPYPRCTLPARILPASSAFSTRLIPFIPRTSLSVLPPECIGEAVRASARMCHVPTSVCKRPAGRLSRDLACLSHPRLSDETQSIVSLEAPPLSIHWRGRGKRSANPPRICRPSRALRHRAKARRTSRGRRRRRLS
jgi:hypothetical protein